MNNQMGQMGEYIVGACLKLLEKCDFVDYTALFEEWGRQ